MLETITAEVTWLDFNRNEIQDISMNYTTRISYSSVTHMYMEHNKLTVLPAYSMSLLSVFPGLQELSFAYNRIEVIVKSAFTGLHHLQELRLSYNILQSLPDGGFHGLAKLIFLHLHGNKLQRIPSKGFLGLEKVHTLDLSYNRIHTVKKIWLDTLPSIENLFLGENKISTFEPETFTWPETIQKLDLHNNELRIIPPLPIQDCFHLPIEQCQGRRAKALLHGNGIYCGCRRPEHGQSLINKLLPALSVCCIDVEKYCPKASNGKTSQNYSLQIYDKYFVKPICRKPSIKVRFSKVERNLFEVDGEPKPSVTIVKKFITAHYLGESEVYLRQKMAVTCEASNVYGSKREIVLLNESLCNSEGIKNITETENTLLPGLTKGKEASQKKVCFPIWSVVTLYCCSCTGICVILALCIKTII